MAVAPFEKTCTACHLDQIIGKGRASGPKGIAFLTLPGLDLQTLRKKNAAIGEWPDASEAELTPFMKIMISRDERGRALIKTVDSLNLQDLTDASDDQIKAVTNLVWEVKGLFNALIKEKASDVLGNLNIGGGTKLSANFVADLTASIPRDVVISAHQEWLPNLATEMVNHRDASDQKQSGWGAVIKGSRLDGSTSREERPGSRARQVAPRPNPRAAGRDRALERGVGRPADTGGAFGRGGGGAAGPGGAVGRGGGGAAGPSRLGGPAVPSAMRAGAKDAEKATQPEGAAEESDAANAPAADDEQRLAADEGDGSTIRRWTLPSGTPRSIEAARRKDAGKAAEPEGATENPNTGDAEPDDAISADAASKADANAPADAPADSDTANAKADGGKEQPPAHSPAADQSDDLLFPTEEELRAIKAGNKGAVEAAPPEEAAGKTDAANAKRRICAGGRKCASRRPGDSDTAAANPTRAAPGDQHRK